MTLIPAGTRFEAIPVGTKIDLRSEQINESLTVYTMDDITATVEANLPPVPAYKVYTASLTQTGTDPATVIVLENTIDPGITFNALGNGNFEIISPLNAFTLNKTVGFPVMFGDDSDSPLISYTIFNDLTGNLGGLYVRRPDFNPTNIIGDNNANIRCPIEIRVYS